MSNVFKYGLIVFIICAFLTNNQTVMFTGLLETPMKVFDLIKMIVLSGCLWNGFLNIIKASGFIHHLSFICKPILYLIYGSVIEQEEIFLYLSSNFIANLLGVGSLASISGLQAMKAMKPLQKDPNVPCKEMMILVIMNCTGLSIVPTTMMTIRQNYGSLDILGFFKYSIIIGIIITIVGVITSKVIEHYD